MSYNGSGTFQINTSGQPVVTGTSISSTVFNALTADLATGLSTAITKDGQTTTTARIPFALGINSTLVTDATNTTSGSIISAGGVGIAKALYVGTTANVAGAVTLGGVATFSAQPIFSSLTASSAVATDASKGLVSVTNTGTGNNVLATGPTISGPTISDGTANGVAYLNGSKVLTTGSALVFDGTNLGVGTSSPATKLNVAISAANETTSALRLTNLSAAGYGIGIEFADELSSGRVVARIATNTPGTSATGDLYFQTRTASALTEKMRLDSSGNLLVGTTSVGNGDALVTFRKNTSLAVRGTTTDAAGNIAFVRSDTNVSAFLIAGTGATWYFANADFSYYGYLNQTMTAWNFASDRRIKTDISDIEYGLDAVMAMKPRKYKMISSGETNIGFVAQELQTVIPEAVTGEEIEYFDTDTPQEKAEKTMGVSKETLIPVLVKAIQEQQAIITTLTDRITALEARNE